MRQNLRVFPIDHESLEIADVDRLVHLAAAACALAAMVADAATNRRKRIVFLDGSQRVLVAPQADQRNIALGAL